MTQPTHTQCIMKDPTKLCTPHTDRLAHTRANYHVGIGAYKNSYAAASGKLVWGTMSASSIASVASSLNTTDDDEVTDYNGEYSYCDSEDEPLTVMELPTKRKRTEYANSTPNRYSSDKAKERQDKEVVVALRGISKTLNQLVKRVESTETEVKNMKGRLKGVSNSSSIGETPTQVSVPLFVRVSEGIRLLKLKLV